MHCQGCDVRTGSMPDKKVKTGEKEGTTPSFSVFTEVKVKPNSKQLT
jgi:hypothetical protein